MIDRWPSTGQEILPAEISRKLADKYHISDEKPGMAWLFIMVFTVGYIIYVIISVFMLLDHKFCIDTLNSKTKQLSYL